MGRIPGICRVAVGRATAGAAVLALAGFSAVPAHAAFPNCQPVLTTPNPSLEPSADGTYPSDPALPYAGTHTVWSVNGGIAIQQKIGAATTSPFIVHGVNYEPTQIGGAASFSPFNDFFYVTDTSLWNPIWMRDVSTLRALGVNAIRNYGMWKVEPGFNKGGNGVTATGVAKFWPQIDFKANADQPRDQQFCLPGDNSVYAFQHRSHRDFLDLLWNKGKNPIYVWIGISLPLQLVDPNTPAGDRKQYLQFYRYTAKWLAKMYGNHPAVMGFVVGNEIDTAGTVPTLLFWQTLNDIGQVVKASAPDKLTMSVFHDTDDYNSVVTDAPGMPKGPQIYGLDVFGINPYTNPARPNNLFDRYRKNVVECTRPDGTSCKRPLLFGEFGVPADAHEQNSSLSNDSYPVNWTEPNFVWNPTPPPATCLSADQLGPPPGPGGKGPNAEARANATIGIELSSRSGSYELPSGLATYFPGYSTGTPLGGALQADWIASFLEVSAQYKADPAAPPSQNKFSSGGFVFEWRDEWWKGNETYPYFHSISGNDQCGAGCPGACDTGAANPVFPGGWGDEEWFGIAGAAPNKRKASDPVVNPNTGKLNGGPDTLEPRAAVIAICKAYAGPGCP